MLHLLIYINIYIYLFIFIFWNFGAEQLNSILISYFVVSFFILSFSKLLACEWEYIGANISILHLLYLFYFWVRLQNYELMKVWDLDKNKAKLITYTRFILRRDFKFGCLIYEVTIIEGVFLSSEQTCKKPDLTVFITSAMWKKNN